MTMRLYASRWGLPLVAQRLVCAGCLLLLIGLPGCSGCNKETRLAKKKQQQRELQRRKSEEKPKPPVEVGRLSLQPSETDLNLNVVKPGHWVSAVLPVRANDRDYRAELLSSAVSRSGEPLEVWRTRFRMTISRPAPLPKDQIKRLETTLFIPRDDGADSQAVLVQTRLSEGRGGRELPGGTDATTKMPGFQYFMVVLSNDPDSFAYLKWLDSVRAPSDELSDAGGLTYYRVALPRVDRVAPLPSHPLAWTSIAYILWDEIHPRLVTPVQQQAMLDWLHWGGQLVISGPGSLENLKGSFLEEYLPAEASSSAPLAQQAFADLNRYWLPQGVRPQDRRELIISQDAPPLGAALKLRPPAEFAPCAGQLVAERRVGGGRIAVTAFSLTERQLVNWRHYDGFFNGCLLRRPRREFRRTRDGLAETLWADHPNLTRDPRLVASLRYFSRDIGHTASGPTPDDNQRNSGVRSPDADGWRIEGYEPSPEAGVAGWNDSSGAADAAREMLQEAAGISVPNAGFVLRVLAVYLVVLAPLNWGLFRVIGRVEWAWAAAPVIAVCAALTVVKLAQLDIGFVRSRTELALLEAQSGYPRAHLTRYTALYTSLSTSYELAFDDPSAVAQPFSTNPAGEQRALRDAAISTVLRYGDRVSLRGFQVSSNATDMVHSEQMLDLRGTLLLTGDHGSGERLENNTAINLRDAGVLRRTSQGVVESAWIGDLPSRASAPLRFVATPGGQQWLAQWDGPEVEVVAESADVKVGQETIASVKRGQRLPVRQRQGPWLGIAVETASGPRSGWVLASRARGWLDREGASPRLECLVRLASEQPRLGHGDARLVAWTDDELPGAAVRPRASQESLRTIVLAHLRCGPPPMPRRDLNTRADIEAPAAEKPADDDGLPPEPPAGD